MSPPPSPDFEAPRPQVAAPHVTALDTTPSNDASNGDAENGADNDGTWMRRHENNVVNKSSKARPNKGQYGWGNLPAELINRILTVSCDMLEVEPLRIPANRMPVVQAIIQRGHLSRMREVSNGWAAAVNSHPFWMKYLRMMRPDVDDTRLPKHLSPFKNARIHTSIVCIPCKLFNLNNFVSAAHRGAAMYTSALGRLPTCETHQHSYCTSCLRWNEGRDDIRLILKEKDVFMNQERVGSVFELVCRFCREAAFSAAIQTELTICARESPITHGITAPWVESPSWWEYVNFGTATVKDMAERAVEDMFLLFNTRWNELQEPAFRLHLFLMRLKVQMFRNHPFTLSGNEFDQYDNLVGDLWDEELSDENVPDLRTLLRQWHHQIATHQYTEGDCANDMIRIQYRNPLLLSFIRDKVVDLCIEHWASTRFFFGYWVMPVDEVRQYCTPTAVVHTPFHQLALHARRPASNSAHSPGMLHRHLGRFRPPGLNPDGTDSGFFLPPPALLVQFNDQFKSIFQRRLEVPLAEIVELYRTTKGPVQAELYCASLGMSQLLYLMQNKPAWIEGRLALHRQHLANNLPELVATEKGDEEGEEEEEYDVNNSHHSNPPSDAGGDTVISDDEVKSPRIELVGDDTPVQGHFTIKEGWDSCDEEKDEWEDEEGHSDKNSDAQPATDPTTPSSPPLGKRKQSEEVDKENGDSDRLLRPRLGSGQASNSSSGDTVNTALVTPDDSPALMPGTIQLAAEEEHGVEPAPVADPSSPTSSLGKRKHADDNDSQRPARRRDSRSSSSDGSATLAGSDPTEAGERPDIETVEEDQPAESADRIPTAKETVTAVPRLPSRTSSATSEAESVTVSSRSSAPKQLADDAAYESDFESDSGSDVEFDYGPPFVPAPASELGRHANTLITDMWWTARGPLRECHCSICQRAKNEDMARLLFNAGWDRTVLRVD